MVVLQNKDMLDVKLSSLIAEYDYETLTNLYQPLVGYAALALYFTLIYEAKNQKVQPTCSHEQLLVRMQIATGDFIKARKMLEAVGLIKTFLASEAGVNFYTYEIFAPKTPRDFFDDALLYGLLIKFLGEPDANKLKAIYKSQNNDTLGNEVTASYGEIFRPDFDDPVFVKAMNNDKNSSLGRKKSKIDTEFSYETFFEELAKVSQINQNAINKKQMKEIERLAALYGVNETDAAQVVASSYDPMNDIENRIDFKAVTKAFQDSTNYAFLAKTKNKKAKANTVSGDSDLASKINLMETVSPKDFLSILQGGNKPATLDLWIIESLSKNFQLENAVINVIVDYILQTNNNNLNKGYAEKIAASLAREGIETAVDAMNFLTQRTNKADATKSNTKKGTDAISSSNSNDDKEMSKEDWDKLLDLIDKQ